MFLKIVLVSRGYSADISNADLSVFEFPVAKTAKHFFYEQLSAALLRNKGKASRRTRGFDLNMRVFFFSFLFNLAKISARENLMIRASVGYSITVSSNVNE